MAEKRTRTKRGERRAYDAERALETNVVPAGTGPFTPEHEKAGGRATRDDGSPIVSRPRRLGYGADVVDAEGREHPAAPSRANSPPTREAHVSAPRSGGARGKGGGGRSRPDDTGAHASSGRSGSVRAAKHATYRETHADVRGAASSGEQRGATLSGRPGVRVAGGASSGTVKTGAKRGARRRPS